MASLRHVADRTYLLERADRTVVVLNKIDSVGEICWGHFWYRVGDLYGFMNELGERICEPTLVAVRDFEKSMHAPVKSSKGWGFIDNYGRATCKLEYDAVYSYNNGVAKVEKDSKILYLDRVGVEPNGDYMNDVFKKIWEGK